MGEPSLARPPEVSDGEEATPPEQPPVAGCEPAVSKEERSRPSTIVMYGPKGKIELATEVWPVVQRKHLPWLLGNWRDRCFRYKRRASLLVEPFAVYLFVHRLPVAHLDGQPVLRLSFGATWEGTPRPEDCLIGGTRYLWFLTGELGAPDPALLARQTAWWMRCLRRDIDYKLPAIPDAAGIGRVFLKTIYAVNPEVGFDVVDGIGTY